MAWLKCVRQYEVHLELWAGDGPRQHAATLLASSNTSIPLPVFTSGHTQTRRLTHRVSQKNTHSKLKKSTRGKDAERGQACYRIDELLSNEAEAPTWRRERFGSECHDWLTCEWNGREDVESVAVVYHV